MAGLQDLTDAELDALEAKLLAQQPAPQPQQSAPQQAQGGLAGLTNEQLDALEQRIMAERADTSVLQRVGEAVGLPETARAINRRGDELFGGVNRGLSRIAGAGPDLVASGVNAVGGLLGAEEPIISNPVGGSASIQNALQSVGALGREPTDTTGRILAGVGSAFGESALPAGALARLAAKSTRPLVQALTGNAGQQPGRFLAAESALSSASGGLAAGAREEFPDNPLAEALAAVLPAGPGMLFAGASQLARRAAGSQATRAADAAQDLGVSLSASQRGAPTGTLENIISITPGGSIVIARAARRTQQQLGDSVARISRGMSPTGLDVSSTAAGQAVQKGIPNFVSRFKTQGEVLFNRVGQLIPGTTPAQVSNTARVFDDLTAPIPGAEQLSGVLANPKVQRLAAAFAESSQNGTLPYRALAELRTRVGRELTSSEIISGAPRAQLKQLYAALSRDMEQAATSAGPEALKTFRRANENWRVNLQRIDDHLGGIAKKVDPDDVFRTVERGSASTINTLRKSLTENEWGTVSSAILRRMGRPRAGTQSVDDAFSSESFLKNWTDMTEAKKNALFPPGGLGGQTRKDIDKVVEVASAVRRGSRAGRTSGASGQNVGNAAGLLTAIFVDPLVAGKVAGASSLSGLVLTSPSFTRWAALIPGMKPQNIPGHIVRLGALASSPEEMEIVNDFLNSALNEAEQNGPSPQEKDALLRVQNQ